MFPAGKDVQEELVGGVRVFTVLGADAELLGYGFICGSYGYKSLVSCLIGITQPGLIVGVEVVGHYETYMYFAMIRDWFFNQFPGMDIEQVDVDTGDFLDYRIDAVSGATISCYAIIDDVWKAFRTFAAVTSRN